MTINYHKKKHQWLLRWVVHHWVLLVAPYVTSHWMRLICRTVTTILMIVLDWDPLLITFFPHVFFSVLLIVICRTLKNIIICFLCYYFIDNMSSKPPPQPVEQSWLLPSIRSSWRHFPAEATFPPLPMIQGGVFEESNAYKKKCNHLLNRKRSMCKLALEWQLVFNLD